MAVCSFIVGFILVMTRFVSGLSETKQGCRTVSYVVHHLHQVRSVYFVIYIDEGVNLYIVGVSSKRAFLQSGQCVH